jgi:hypothetical protein
VSAYDKNQGKPKTCIKRAAQMERNEILRKVKEIEGISHRQAVRVLGVAASFVITLGARHHQKTKRAFCTCRKYNELYREGVSKAYVFETPLSFYNYSLNCYED